MSSVLKKLPFGVKLGVLLSTLLLLPLTAFAAEGGATIDTGDTAWVLASAVLVLLMTVPGLALFYGGLMGKRNVLSTTMHSLSSILIVTVVWVLWGYTLAFGTDVAGIIGGLDFLGFNGVGMDATTLTVPHIIFAMFQIMFAALTVALISGGIAGRVNFGAWVPFTILWTTFIYAPFAHWVWGGGWLAQMGELDFAGGTVVHILSGVSALVAALVIGPRLGYPKKSLPPHNVVYFLAGAALLWIGWMGFNAGSALSAGALAAQAFATTQAAAAAAGFTWFVLEWILRKKPTIVGAATGLIAGLVGITPAAGFVTVPAALVIGFGAALICYFGVNFMKAKLKYDDTLDVFGVHGLGGIWGAIATGIFATTSINPAGKDGLLYGNPEQLVTQLIGVGTAIAFAAIGTFVILKAISLFTSLRVSKEEEINGLDFSQHGELAYNTFEPTTSDLSAASLEEEAHLAITGKPSTKEVVNP